MQARKNNQPRKAEVLKLIKAKLIEFTTQKNAPVLDKKTAINIIKKMNTEVLNDMSIAQENNRLDLVEKCEYESFILESFLPKQATREEMIAVLDEIIPNGITQREMSTTIKSVKERFESVDGKLLSELVKERIN